MCLWYSKCEHQTTEQVIHGFQSHFFTKIRQFLIKKPIIFRADSVQYLTYYEKIKFVWNMTPKSLTVLQRSSIKPHKAINGK